MSDLLSELLEYVEVNRVDTYLFTGNSPERPKRIFGGQVLAQCLNAANRSVGEDRIAHSLHAYFLRPGNPKKQIVFEVEPTRDGRSFASRRVVAKQDAKPIFTTSVSYQVVEEGLTHEAEMPEVAAPETLQTDHDFWQEMHEKYPDRFGLPFAQAVERRVVERRDYINPKPVDPFYNAWFKVPGDLGDDPVRHQTLLAFISDFALLGAALLPHPHTSNDRNMQIASLDHAIWFHRPGRVDDYLLYSMDSPNAGGGRGFSRGQFFSRDGRLIASTAQESLIRLRDN